VPAEYLNVPQPTEVRVGDFVKGTFGFGADASGYVDEIDYRDDGQHGVLFPSVRASRRDGRVWSFAKYVGVIDDTREEVAA
jgi:hypothetical protein